MKISEQINNLTLNETTPDELIALLNKLRGDDLIKYLDNDSDIDASNMNSHLLNELLLNTNGCERTKEVDNFIGTIGTALQKKINDLNLYLQSNQNDNSTFLAVKKLELILNDIKFIPRERV